MSETETVVLKQKFVPQDDSNLENQLLSVEQECVKLKSKIESTSKASIYIYLPEMKALQT